METNTVRCTLDVIGGKWKPIILCILKDDGKKRNSELMKEIGNVSQKVLTQQLRELEKDGIINRIVYPTVPPKVEYEISEYGLTLSNLLFEMCVWGKQHINSINK